MSKRLFLLILMCVAVWIGKVTANPDPVSIPAQLAYTEGTIHSENPEDPTLVIIHDAHARYEAQQSMIEVLRYLIRYYHLEFVLVEGGAGNVDLSYMREGVSDENLQKIATQYLRLGKLSAEEYLDLTLEEGDLKLWGVEDSELYQKNVESYLAFYEVQNEALTILQQFSEDLETEKSNAYPPKLFRLSNLRTAAQEDLSGLFEFLSAVKQYADELQISLNESPRLLGWFDIRNKEADIDQSKVELEKKNLLRILTKTRTEEELYAIHEYRKQEGLEADIALFESMLNLRNAHLETYKDYPIFEIERYLLIMQSVLAMDLDAVFDEADLLYRMIRNKELTDPDAQLLGKISDYVTLLKSLFQVQWTPDQEERFHNFEKAWTDSDLDRLMGGKDTFEQIESWAKLATEIYYYARQREQAIHDKTIAFIKTRRAPLYVLIVGGFHAQDLISQFENQKLHILSVLPKFEIRQEKTPYFEVLREKWGDGSAWYRTTRMKQKPQETSESQAI